MLRELGAVEDVPVPADSPLERLQMKVDTLATREELQRGLDVLRAAIEALANPGIDEDHRAGVHGP